MFWVQKELICRDLLLFLNPDSKTSIKSYFLDLRNPPRPSPDHWICSPCNWTIPDSCFKKDSPNLLLLLARGWQSAPLFFWWILLSVTPVSFVSRLRGIILKITMSGLDFQNSPQQHQIFYVTLSLWTSRSNWQSTWIISEVSAPTNLPVYFPILLVILSLVRAMGYTREYFLFHFLCLPVLILKYRVSIVYGSKNNLGQFGSVGCWA